MASVDLHSAELDEDTTVQGLARQLHQVRALIESFREREADLVERLAAEMDEDVLDVDGLPPVRRQWSTNGKRSAWQHDSARSAVVRRIRQGAFGRKRIADLATGEVIEEDDVALTVRAFQLVAHVDYWKVKEMADIGLDVDEFSKAPGSNGKYVISFDEVVGQ